MSKRCQRCNWELEYGESDSVILMDHFSARLCQGCRIAFSQMTTDLPETAESHRLSVRVKMAFALTQHDGKDRSDEVIEMNRQQDDLYRKAAAKAKIWVETKQPQPAPKEPEKPVTLGAQATKDVQDAEDKKFLESNTPPVPMCKPEATAAPSLESKP